MYEIKVDDHVTIFMIIIIGISFLVLVYLFSRDRKKKDGKSIATIDADQNDAKPVQEMNFSATSVDYEEQLTTITTVIEEFKQKGKLIDQPYMGLTDKAIYKTGIRTYELAGAGLPTVYVEKEANDPFDSSAIKVIVQDVRGSLHHIGDVPARLRSDIREYMQDYKMEVSSSIIGGAYKDIVIDEDGNEIVQIFSSDYGLHIQVSFWDVHNACMEE